MTRTNELRQAGALRRGEPKGNERALLLEPTPFVKWPAEEHAWVEGEVKGLWSGNYGENVTLTVTGHSNELMGKTRDVEVSIVTEMEVNVGLNPSTLRDTITDADEGKRLHIAFEGWKEPANGSGNRYRLFTVLEIPYPVHVAATEAQQVDVEETASEELPF
jgi:hypothetical protein